MPSDTPSYATLVWGTADVMNMDTMVKRLHCTNVNYFNVIHGCAPWVRNLNIYVFVSLVFLMGYFLGIRINKKVKKIIVRILDKYCYQ